MAGVLVWCEDHRVPSITAVQPVHVAGYIEELTRARSAPTAKQRARVGAALAMKVEDVFVQNRRLWVRLREKAASGAPADHGVGIAWGSGVLVSCRGRHQDPGRQSHLPRDRDNGLPQERRFARKCRRHGEPRLDPHSAALRSPA
jgi:hypothetical protein